jgi:hypothetical protein
VFDPFGETVPGGPGQPGFGPQGFSYGGFNNYGVDPAMTGFGVSNPSNALAPGLVSALDDPYSAMASAPYGYSATGVPNDNPYGAYGSVDVPGSVYGETPGDLEG